MSLVLYLCNLARNLRLRIYINFSWRFLRQCSLTIRILCSFFCGEGRWQFWKEQGAWGYGSLMIILRICLFPSVMIFAPLCIVQASLALLSLIAKICISFVEGMVILWRGLLWGRGMWGLNFMDFSVFYCVGFVKYFEPPWPNLLKCINIFNILFFNF